MKDCLRYAPMIGAREGELTPDEARALAAHLEACPSCAAVAADLAATDGLVSEALLARAAQRDFAPFVDQVMDRVYGLAPERAGALGWLRRHWRGLAATALPALAAATVFLYVRLEGADGTGAMALVELHAEGATTVLQTADGPVVLLSDEDAGT
jgi:anti-sigma factor RsiW